MFAFYNRACENIMKLNINVLKLQKWCRIKVK